ncbi:MAG: cadmium resistance transporter [Cyanobacteriota bacterium]|jgi:cadmium resistance protein CadD (predicted permease)
MGAFLQPVLEAATAFSATNIDDLLILILFFSRLSSSLRAWHVVCGQFLGIAALVAVSLLSLLGRVALPEGLLGLLGLFPISLGLSQLAETFDASRQNSNAPCERLTSSAEGGMASILGVASLTIANGSDNISVYMALLANSDSLRLRVLPLVFALLTSLWCLLAWWLSQTSALAQPLRRLQRDLAPILLLVIGAVVLHDSQPLRHPVLAMVELACLGVMVASLIQPLRQRLRARRLATTPQP